MNEKVSQKPISVNQSTQQFWRNIAIGIILVIVFLSLPNYCSGDCGHDHHGHGCDHDHHHHVNEPASFKWSQQANEHHHEESGNTGHQHDHDHHHKTPTGMKIINE